MVGAWELTNLDGAAPSANQAATFLCNADGAGLTTTEAGHAAKVVTIAWLSSASFQFTDAGGNVMVFNKF